MKLIHILKEITIQNSKANNEKLCNLLNQNKEEIYYKILKPAINNNEYPPIDHNYEIEQLNFVYDDYSGDKEGNNVCYCRGTFLFEDFEFSINSDWFYIRDNEQIDIESYVLKGTKFYYINP